MALTCQTQKLSEHSQKNQCGDAEPLTGAAAACVVKNLENYQI